MIRMAALLMVALIASTASAESLKVGQKAPAFKGKGVDGKEYSLDGMKDAKAVVVALLAIAARSPSNTRTSLTRSRKSMAPKAFGSSQST